MHFPFLILVASSSPVARERWQKGGETSLPPVTAAAVAQSKVAP